MKCDICKSQETYIKDYEHNYCIKGKNISFIEKRRFCKSCNNLVYDSDLDNNASEIAINKYNEEYGITKEEIVDLRKTFNLSIELFAKIIGCAKKTLINYEKGKSIPNDSYLIILKSLKSKPETIKTIIDANKEQFTEKEYNKINEKIASILPNNTKQLIFNSEYTPNEYNGYSKLSKEKIYNIILFFSNQTVLKTKLLKEMFYTDFLYYKNNCKSITGLEYAKLPYGPVPDQFESILNECSKENMIKFKIEYNNQYESHNISAIKKFDSKVFDEDELEILKQVKEKFKNYSSKDIVDFSHKEKAFTSTEFFEKISYDYAFDIESI
jgi:putative zinc finger/helix-turn-helix YgiT family protein